LVFSDTRRFRFSPAESESTWAEFFFLPANAVPLFPPVPNGAFSEFALILTDGRVRPLAAGIAGSFPFLSDDSNWAWKITFGDKISLPPFP